MTGHNIDIWTDVIFMIHLYNNVYDVFKKNIQSIYRMRLEIFFLA